jgi:hypothetical protein
MDFAKFVHLLETQQLWFSRLDKMTDPFEGSLSPATDAVIEYWVRKGPELSEDEVKGRKGKWRQENYIV